MFLSVGILSANSFCQNTIPSKKTFSTIKLYGQCELSNIHLLNVELSEEEILDLNEQTRNINTRFLADFENSLEAGNLVNGGLPITSWRIRRRAEGELLNTFLDEMPNDGSNIYIDKTGANKVNYTYNVYPISGQTEGGGLGGLAYMDFWGWILSDSNTTYKFDMEIESSEIQNINDVKKYDNYTQFPSFRFGKRLYKEGSLTTIPYSIDGDDYIIDVALLNSLLDFINNKQPKTLKNAAGESILVITYDATYKYYDEVSDQPYKVSFKWTQIG